MNHPFRNILVPVDFSPQTSEAIAVAAGVSRRYQAPLTLAHVFQPAAYALPDGFVLYTPAQLTELLAEFDRRLAEAAAAARAAGAFEVAVEKLDGVPATEIVELARRGHFDLIVMGTHGHTGIRHALLGSVTEKVVRTAPCPVLTVRSGKPG